MRLTEKMTGRWGSYYWQGKKNNILFDITPTNKLKGNKEYYVTAKCKVSDKRYNSLWDNLVFSSVDEAREFCESFKFDKEES